MNVGVKLNNFFRFFSKRRCPLKVPANITFERERKFISLLIMNDTHKKISIIYRRIVKLATGSCEGTSGL